MLRARQPMRLSRQACTSKACHICVALHAMRVCMSSGEWKRNYLSALSASVETVLPFLVKLLQVRGVLGKCEGGKG
jgi:hypothetical protein